MRSSFLAPRPSPSRSGFTLVEMMVVMAIMLILASLGVAAFKGGSNGDGTRGAANAASSIFSQARSEAIMRRTYAAVIVDTNTADPLHCFRRMMTVYLYQDPTALTWSWQQGSPWTMLPGNNYFDPGWSNPFGSLSPNLTSAPGPYAYYGFDSTGQASLLNGTNPDGTPIPNVSVNPAITFPAGQFLVSPGTESAGTFTPRDTHSRYGFYLFPLGRIAFFQDIVDDLKTQPSNPWGSDQ